MNITIAEAIRRLEDRRLVERQKDTDTERVIERVQTLLGGPIHEDLKQLYRENLRRIGDFWMVAPGWNAYRGWSDGNVDELLAAQAVPIFDDGCGSWYGVDLSSGSTTPAVYFFDHDDGFEFPAWAAGSTIARFLLMLPGPDGQGAFFDKEWCLPIDPDLDRCPRARSIWNAG